MTNLYLAIQNVPEDVFWQSEERDFPDYNAIFAWLLQDHYGVQEMNTKSISLNMIARFYNISSLQRTVPKEAARRRTEVMG